MKKATYFLFSVILSGIFYETTAQYDINSIKKYWFYRKRFLDYFTVVGPGTGESNVANRRNNQDATTQGLGLPGTGIIVFGDQTTNLGDYIGVLATEYKLLTDNGRDVTQTSMELYYALFAFNRLDLLAETFFLDPVTGTPITPSLDGFFVRDDVPQGTPFITSHDLNKNISPVETTYVAGSGMPQRVNIVADSKIQLYPVPQLCNDGNKEDGLTANEQIDFRATDLPSPDQIIDIFKGMALVVKCVPSNANYNGLTFQDGIVNFVEEAKAITNRIASNLQVHGWQIVSPTGCVLWIEPSLIAYGFAIAAGEIIEDRNYYLDALAVSTATNWCAIAGILAAGDVCNVLADWKICERDHNWKIALTLASIGNSWKDCDCNALNNKTLVYSLLGVNICALSPINLTNLLILYHSSYFDWGSYYSLLFNVLNGGNYYFQNSTTESQLNTAPCDGPYNHDAGHPDYVNDYACCGWATPFRFRATLDEQSGAGGFARGHFHGLDNMLLHNLYYIHRLQADGEDSQGNDLPLYVSYMDGNVTIDYPHLLWGQWEGSVADPITIQAFRSITANNNIKVIVPNDDMFTGDVTYRAGEEISLEGEFEVQEGAEFFAYIDPFSCVGSAYARQSGDTTGRHFDTGNNDPTNPSIYGMDYTIPGKNNIVPLTYDQPIAVPQKDISVQAARIDSSAVSKNNANSTVAAATQQNEPPAFFLMAPNPSIGQFAILSNKPCDFEATITDVLGRTVFQRSVKNNIRLNIDLNAGKGIYFVKVITNNEVFVNKLILE